MQDHLVRATWNKQSFWDWSHHLEGMYGYVPVWMQNLGISLYGIAYRRERLGGVFASQVAAFHERDRWSIERMQDYVEKELQRVLSNAFCDVPYYSQKWRAAGIRLSDLQQITPANLLKIPVTPKRDLAADANSFVTRQVGRENKLTRYYSSGSTGTPVTCILSAQDHQRFIAAREVRSFCWAGTSVRWPRSTMGGRMVVSRANSRGPYYRYNRAERQVYFSAYHISPHNVCDYVRGLNRYRPQVMTGYAHSHYTLARMMLACGMHLDYVPAALVLSSEKLTAHMKAVIRQAFRARAYEEYGAVENCVLATECEEGRLHISSDFGIVEILDEHDRPVPVGETGRIVCTGLLNETQPLIRYDIGDLGVLSKSRCPCGRNQLPVLQEVVGRTEDVVVGPDGRQTVRFHSLFTNLPHVLEGQVIQEQLNVVRVRVVTKTGFGEGERELIRKRLRERLGATGVEVEVVHEIERSERGKFRAVISRIPEEVRNQVGVAPRRA
jgi:phenylacetate-CoA ligase